MARQEVTSLYLIMALVCLHLSFGKSRYHELIYRLIRILALPFSRVEQIILSKTSEESLMRVC